MHFNLLAKRPAQATQINAPPSALGVYSPPPFQPRPCRRNPMDPAVFEEWMMTGLISILIIFMGFIVWDLAKKSKAGRFGSFILFFVLGLGVAAFIIKSVVIGLIESGAL
jgi:hypothetical protein